MARSPDVRRIASASGFVAVLVGAALAALTPSRAGAQTVPADTVRDLAGSLAPDLVGDVADVRPRVPTRAAFARSGGVSLMLTSSGLGAGIVRNSHIGGAAALVTEAAIGGIRDERETKYAGLGGTAIQAKRTFVVAVPLRAGVSVRVFERDVAPNVRPYLHLAVGPTFGWSYPYFGDCNANGDLDVSVDCNADGVVAAGEGERPLGFFEAQRRGRVLIGAGGVAGVGAHVGWGRRVQGLRLAYRLDVFPTGVALLESRVRGRQRVFASPEVSLTFGRLR